MLIFKDYDLPKNTKTHISGPYALINTKRKMRLEIYTENL